MRLYLCLNQRGALPLGNAVQGHGGVPALLDPAVFRNTFPSPPRWESIPKDGRVQQAEATFVSLWGNERECAHMAESCIKKRAKGPGSSLEVSSIC